MYVSSCPLRISLFGGSTDSPYFVEKYGRGSVISFTCNLKTYITLHEDKLGYNMQGKKYIVNYSKREETEYINDIKNDLVRVSLNYFKCNPITVSMTSDAYSQGSGLASSSSYMISLIKCISMFNNLHMTDAEICKLSFLLEREFNEFCGYQDPYGCGIGGFKKIDFEKGGIVKYNFLPTDIFDVFDTHLVFTGVTRNSRNILQDVTSNLEKSLPLLKTVDESYEALLSNDYEKFLNLLNRSWEEKKNTSSSILENPIVAEIDKNLSENQTVISNKLCGAGNGGFFLTFSEKGNLDIPYQTLKINIETNGVIGKHL